MQQQQMPLTSSLIVNLISEAEGQLSNRPFISRPEILFPSLPKDGTTCPSVTNSTDLK
jgi:hypothetical protein